MSASAPVVSDRLTDQHGLTEHSHHGSSAQIRSKGVDSHLHGIGSADPAAHPLPSAKNEVWRFTPLRRLQGLGEDRAFDGIVGADNERTVEGPAGITVRRVSGAEAAALKGISGNLPTDRPSARAWQASDSILLIDVPAETEFREPLIVTFAGGTVDRAFAGHLVVRVGRHAKAQVAILHEGTQLLSDNMEIVVGDGAQLEFVALEEWDSRAVHLSHHHIRVGRDATVKHTALTFGGDLVRVVADVVYDGPGGSVELNGLYFADAGQHLEHRLFVDHAVPHCTSRALYKGALQGEKARTVWVGDVLIRRAAEGTDTYEMNRNLVLTEGARADSVPNLEIETGDIVGAGHASATGRFDDEQLFYLLSRGIPAEVAKRLVVRGFFGEVLLKIGIESVRERTSQIIERELAIAGI
ncbi:Fe-S cluster assembly protein SufD [Nakamurella sp.]|uniref:Fe-S cluster assembly protein SufD n=1 Tax=Nakamurella sp. TaxID=1869182 RepID=UPI00378323EE